MRFWIVSVIFIIFAYLPARGFPPAPGTVVYGIVRDTNGQVVDGPNAFIVFKSGDVEVARSSLQAGISPEENYRALLPNDMDGVGDSYRDEVLNAALPFTVEVEIAGRVFDPIESVAGLESPDEPGETVRLDFALGTDSDGDRLPDEWEYSQLKRVGIEIGSEDYNLDHFSGDSDFDNDGLTDRVEYLAGTFAYFTIDSLRIENLQLEADGRLSFSVLGVENGVFEVEGSNNLRSWETLEVWVEGDDSIAAGLVGLFRTQDVRTVTVFLQLEDVERLSLFRLKIK